MTLNIKTPEQIAADIWNAGHSRQAEACENEILAMIADGARRAQDQLYPHVLSFEPDAIRDHFEADEDDPTEGMSNDELLAVGQESLQSDRLYETFHELLAEALEQNA